ncbi:MAG: phosphoribosylamine--glycine ligase [Myxococcota bacterium]|nr:phosphoribosylamine--glycine ligase [Myxococcota bacterium]
MAKVLVVGSGGREHCIAHVLKKSQSKPDLLIAPGNYGTSLLGENIEVSATDVEQLVRTAKSHQVDLVIVGPEAPLVAGLADELIREQIPVLGPCKEAARLEGSKAFAKEIMHAANVPTAAWRKCGNLEEAIAFAETMAGRVAVKADGLAGGKGVIVCDNIESAREAIAELFGKHDSLVVEEKLEGEELSVIAIVDGENLRLLAPSQDHKRIGEGDTGPNTGGMGAYAPAPLGTEELLRDVEQTCLRPVIEELRSRGIPFCGFLYVGLMLTSNGPRVLEYNVRLGDPETQVILPLMDEDAYEIFLAAAKGELGSTPIRLKPEYAATVVVAAEGYPKAPRVGDMIEGCPEVDNETTILFHAGTAPGENSGEIITSGGRVLAVTGIGQSLVDALAFAYQGVQKICWPGLQFRRDIGHRALRSTSKS